MKSEIYKIENFSIHMIFIRRHRCAENKGFLLSFQISMSVRLTSITVMPMLPVITLMDLLTASAVQDTLEMEHHATVNQYDQYL